jgi:transcriptional regulator with XRE-family HTH domain
MDAIRTFELSALNDMDTPAKRIQWALEQRGMGVRELARRLGVSPGLPSQWWRTTGRTILPDKHLDELANILGANVDWLRYGRGEPFAAGNWPYRDQQEVGAALGTNRARIIGIVEGEVWREGVPMREAMAGSGSRAQTLPFVSREDLQGLEQFAVAVRGHVCDQTIPPGNYAICVEYNRSRPGGPVDGDLVVVEKRRGDEMKALIARLHFLNGGWELRYESNDPRWQQEASIRLAENRTRDINDGHPVDIVGHVRSFVSHDPQPRFGRDFARAAARGLSRFPVLGSTTMMFGAIALITAILAVLGGEQLSPHAIFGYLVVTIIIGLKFGTLLALIGSWLAAGIAGFALYEPVLSLSIDSPVSTRSIIVFVALATAMSLALCRSRGNASA